MYCMLHRCCHCRSQSALCHRRSTLLRKGCRQENPPVSSSAPPNTYWNRSFRHETTIKGKCTLPGVLWALRLSLSLSLYSLLVRAGAPWPNVGEQFCSELCALSITGSFFFLLLVRGKEPCHAPHCPYMNLQNWLAQQLRWWSICQVFVILQYDCYWPNGYCESILFTEVMTLDGIWGVGCKDGTGRHFVRSEDGEHI